METPEIEEFPKKKSFVKTALKATAKTAVAIGAGFGAAYVFIEKTRKSE